MDTEVGRRRLAGAPRREGLSCDMVFGRRRYRKSEGFGANARLVGTRSLLYVYERRVFRSAVGALRLLLFLFAACLTAAYIVSAKDGGFRGRFPAPRGDVVFPAEARLTG